MSAVNCLDSAAEIARSPGRLRITVPGLFRSSNKQRTIETALSHLEHITAVHANPLTGKVLVLFEASVPVTEMLLTLGVPAANDNAAPAGMPNDSERPSREWSNHRPAPSPAAANAARDDIYPPWHLRTADDVLAHYDVASQSGLSVETVERKLRDGLNLLPQARPRSSLELLTSQFKSMPVLLLGVSAALSVVTGGFAEAVSIVTVLALNGAIGFVTERRAEATIASLSELIDESAPVLREGAAVRVPTSHIVPGDVLVLAPGVHVPADARLIQSNGLTIDESALTGESHPVRKQRGALAHAAALAERTNMVYMGTSVAAGCGLAVAVGTGERTEIGTIQSVMAITEQPKTPIQKHLDGLGNRLVMISSAICLGVFAIGLFRGHGWLQMLKSSISLAIAAVPEGLPTVATTSLARGVRIMREKQMLIRRLQAVETLGAVHTICFDKTGTLTMNRMAAVAAVAGIRRLDLVDGGLRPPGEYGALEHGPEAARLLQLCVLSNENEGKNGETNSSVFNGSATENALVRLAEESGIAVHVLRDAFPPLHAELRAEGRNYMRTVHAMPDGRHLVAVKGSPLEVLALCAWFQSGDDAVELSEARRGAIRLENERMALMQLRVLGFAYAEKNASDHLHASREKLVWVGLVGLADPLRPGADRVIESLHRAGIRTTMITGDQRMTAHAIGKSLGLANGKELRIVDAEHLDAIGHQELRALASEADVFARVSPASKLDIVRALQDNGEVVAMTGDGINDGPALRAADVGIAMGRHGTDLARSAADVVLADDRLETLLDAIRQGRTITYNIEKSLHFLISSNLSEILVVLCAISATGTAPLTPMQLLWINLLSDVLPAIALAAEPAEADAMEGRPRDPAKPLIGNDELKRYGLEGACLAGGALGAYLYGLARYGSGARAGSLAFNSLMLGQLLHAFSCRSRHHGIFSNGKTGRNKKLDLAIGGSIALQLLANVLPGMRGLLGIGRTGLLDIGIVFAGASIPALVIEAAKHRGKGKVKVNAGDGVQDGQKGLPPIRLESKHNPSGAASEA